MYGNRTRPPTARVRLRCRRRYIHMYLYICFHVHPYVFTSGTPRTQAGVPVVTPELQPLSCRMHSQGVTADPTPSPPTPCPLCVRVRHLLDRVGQPHAPPCWTEWSLCAFSIGRSFGSRHLVRTLSGRFEPMVRRHTFNLCKAPSIRHLDSRIRQLDSSIRQLDSRIRQLDSTAR